MNQIITCDSFEKIREIEDKSFDLILTDVPYDLTEHQKHMLHTHFKRIAKRCILVFSPYKNQWLFPDIDDCLFWIKPISTKNTSKNYSNFVEMIFLYKQEEYYWDSSRHWSQYTNVFTDLVDDAKLHPHRKPPSLIKRLILNHSNVGDKILDPFCGSGVVMDVCKETNRHSLGIDINPKYDRMI